MPLTLVPPTRPGGAPRRERILAYGPPSSGKSYAWQRILAMTPDHVIFHVIDTDGAWETAAASEEFAPHAHRVVHTEPVDWPEFLDATKRARKLMDKERGDWLVIDMADEAWTSAQEFYEDRRFEGDADSDEFMNALVDGGLEDGEDNMAKWGTINKLYAPFRQTMVRVPGNLYVCATAKELKKDKKGNYFRESKQNIKDFGFIGARPGGQKNLAHDVNTVLYFSKGGGGRREITLMKDRNREESWDNGSVENIDFAKDVLMGINGWEPGT